MSVAESASNPFALQLAALGLGLDCGTVRLVRTRDDWVRAGSQLRDRTAQLLGALAVAVEQVGSTAVSGLLAKPVIDLAVAVGIDTDIDIVGARLEGNGWIYRGDAGADGGHVFVLESRPWFRVAHLHVVGHGSGQWIRYLAFRDALRSDAGLRRCYEETKVRLAHAHAGDRRAYTSGKSGVVSEILRTVTHGAAQQPPDDARA